MDNLQELYEKAFGSAPTQTRLLPGAGSNRRYVRLFGASGETCIGVSGADVAENRAFIYLARHFAHRQLPVPNVLAVSENAHQYLLSDLGNLSLHAALEIWRDTNYSFSQEYQGMAQQGYDLLRRTMCLLARVQTQGAEGLDFDRLLMPNSFCKRSILFDLNYFKYCFLKTYDLAFDEMLLEDDFEALTTALLCCASKTETFLYRDFQSRNVMICDDTPFLIDFQGGRRGPVYYDVASFLWQASAHYPETLRDRLVDEYLGELEKYLPALCRDFRPRLQLFVLFRLLQVLGAYGLRGRFERKEYFLNSIPPALRNLSRLLDTGVGKTFPTLEKILQKLILTV